MLVSLIAWIIVGAIAGWLAGYVMTRNTALNVTDVVLGMVGAVVGGWLSTQFMGVDPAALTPLGIIVAFIGALIVAFIYKAVTGRTPQ